MPPTTFVLKPQHTEVPNAQLLFKIEAQGGMALLPNDYVLAAPQPRGRDLRHQVALSGQLAASYNSVQALLLPSTRRSVQIFC